MDFNKLCFSSKSISANVRLILSTKWVCAVLLSEEVILLNESGYTVHV